ncbi:MAG: hypothetical protein A3H57_01710 [Candidatus Taylorbacteria bacterium RIFCSPLOWO2_02_FULL_43_11]|uniref:Uncharacterized protein n=1 Tax=Candidatus Taylorbacteria bacterium RIFCSPHIGHO2_02_FULL_43_32b TaxID=1802306 RepID=A0A1G2MGT4_9BACT|nr:MAG: hypothetical protein A2743_00070 [Candidatus Taylorbacteria bacterium RIFCSPHIGHO2_01_FULL_43_47]OHA22212.1 MAG: hypothetical protein A3C72_04010 [Candidatus Taylorbacteria bacterium RIFCSPHIGHO2_02_FULL_43_32b]OHA29047.1 MAG: hypothetical protein A3B08_00175 [Candidatus Taylorbacteria bacterium RIFCSPLOWO2_01_FULL_43_44]OHA35705.1 MAG: hypothetical protein A3H57_01710 [Candidatus Taylorbacteria bacterium RIFCSPLOWO2_02_FULL_43_11]
MSFLDWLDKLRELPEVNRRRIVVGTTFALTFTIFIFWLSVRFYDLGSKAVIGVEQKESGPIIQAGQAIGDFIESVKTNTASINSMLSAEASTTELFIEAEELQP